MVQRKEIVLRNIALPIWMIIVWLFYPNRPIGIALANNPFSYLPALILVLLCTAFSAFLIYVFDKRILIKTGKLDDAQVRRSSLIMALCTAPYLFLFPVSAFSFFY